MRFFFLLLTICLVASSPTLVRGQRAQDGSDLFVVIVNDKRGYIDRNGKIVIEPKWNGANNFSEGLAVVATNEGGYHEGYIDTTGKVIIKPQYPKARDFSEGLAAVGFGHFGMHNSGNHKTGFIDQTGALVIKPKYRDAGSFSDGLAWVRDKDKYGFIDKTGRLVIALKFDSVLDFSDGLASVRVKKRWGVIDHSGRFVIPPKYSFIDQFSEGVAAVKQGGTVITNFDYSDFGENSSPETWSYINRNGKTVIKLPKNVESAESFSEGLAPVEVKKGDGYLYNGYIDKTGKFVVQPTFGSADKFVDGIARIILNGNFGYIDKTGRILFIFKYPSDYAMAKDFRAGLAWVQKGGEDVFSNFREAKYGYIDKTGKIIWEPTK